MLQQTCANTLPSLYKETILQIVKESLLATNESDDSTQEDQTQTTQVEQPCFLTSKSYSNSSTNSIYNSPSNGRKVSSREKCLSVLFELIIDDMNSRQENWRVQDMPYFELAVKSAIRNHSIRLLQKVVSVVKNTEALFRKTLRYTRSGTTGQSQSSHSATVSKSQDGHQNQNEKMAYSPWWNRPGI